MSTQKASPRNSQARATQGEATQYAGNGKNVRQQWASRAERGKGRVWEWQWEKTRAAQQENGKYVSSGYKEKWGLGRAVGLRGSLLLNFTHTHTATHIQTLAYLYATTHTHTHVPRTTIKCANICPKDMFLSRSLAHTCTGRRTNTHTHTV